MVDLREQSRALRSDAFAPERARLSVLVKPRLIIEDDIPWIHRLSLKRYPKNYDIDTAERWLRNNVLQNPIAYQAIRTDRAFMISMLNVLPWVPGDPEVNVMALCAEPDAGMDAVRLCRASIEWGRKRKAYRWYIQSETGYDLKPIAMRVGGRSVRERYYLDLRG